MDKKPIVEAVERFSSWCRKTFDLATESLQLSSIDIKTATAGTPAQTRAPTSFAGLPGWEGQRRGWQTLVAATSDGLQHGSCPVETDGDKDEVMLRTLLPRAAMSARTLQSQRFRSVSTATSLITDQSANIGDYPTSVPAINRQTRSETATWDNKQDRRNFNETLHEEDDVMTVFSPDVHTHVKPGTALLHIGIFVAAFFGVVGMTQITFEPLQAVRRTYPYNGLEKELVGRSARSS